MAKKDVVDKVADSVSDKGSVNTLLSFLRENDKKNLFYTNTITTFHKTGFPQFDYYFGSLINVHDKDGNLIKQEPRLGQAAGTFNLIVGNTGSGKAQPLTTKIPTPDGYKLMGDLKVGDRVFGSDGSVNNIVGVYPQGVKDVYEITFSDGRKARCCKDHLWDVIYLSHGEYKKKTVALKDIIDDYKVYSESTKQNNENTGSNRNNYKYKYRIQTLSGPVQYDHKDVPIDPYVLGAFIGNGCLKEKILSISSPDYVVPEYIANRCGFELHTYSDKNYTWTFRNKDTLENIKTDDFFADLSYLINMGSSDKYIPDEYLYNDYETRLSLLQGLMDTDGRITYADGRYNVTYSSTSERLLKQIQELIMSLGFTGNISDDKRIEKYTSGYCGSIHFNVPNWFKHKMFNISYKKSALSYECFGIEQHRRYEYIYIKDIKLVSKEECQCIMVDSFDHLYVTEQFIVTHNTTLAVQIASNIMRQYKNANVIHFDCENRTDISRCENISKLPSYCFDKNDSRCNYILKSGTVALDVIQEMIVKMYVSKMRLKKDISINSGHTDEFGREVSILPPTIIIIDSITTVLNETFSYENSKDVSDAEKMRGNTEGARDAKTLKGFFKDILPLCKEANIIVYGINHINQNMSMNAFTPVAKQQNFLKQDEVIPGGKTMLYYPFNIIKLTARPSDDFSEEIDGFAGHIVMIEPIKSSSNQSGNSSKGISFEMVFSFKDGFDPLRSIIWYAKDNGLLEGNKTRMKFKDNPEYTFVWKNIYTEVAEKPIWNDVKRFVIPSLDKHLPYLEPSETKFDENIFDY